MIYYTFQVGNIIPSITMKQENGEIIKFIPVFNSIKILEEKAKEHNIIFSNIFIISDIEAFRKKANAKLKIII